MAQIPDHDKTARVISELPPPSRVPLTREGLELRRGLLNLPSPRSRNPSPPPTNMDALQDTIKKLQLEQSGEAGGAAKEMSAIKCKKLMPKNKRGKGPCLCPICLPTGTPSVAPPPPPPQVDEQLVKMLVDLCKKKHSFDISEDYARSFLVKENSKLIPALSAIVKDLDARELALEVGGRVSYGRERPLAERSVYQTRDHFVTYLEDDDRDVKEHGEHGFKSHYGRSVQRYKKKEDKERWFNMYKEEAEFRSNRAIEYKAKFKLVQDGSLTIAEFKQRMRVYDGVDGGKLAKTDKGKGKEKETEREPAPGEKGRGKFLAQVRKEIMSAADTDAATVASDESSDDYEQSKEDTQAEPDYDSDDSDLSLETQVTIRAGPNATAAEKMSIRQGIRKEMVASLKKQMAQINEENAFVTCNDCKLTFRNRADLQEHLDDMDVSCTGRGLTKEQELGKVRAEEEAADALLANDPEAREASEAKAQAQLLRDVEAYGGDILAGILVKAKEMDDQPYNCDRCGGVIKTMKGVQAHLSKPQSMCKAYYKDLLGKKYFASIDGHSENEEQAESSASLEPGASTAKKGKKSKKADVKMLSEPLLRIVQDLRDAIKMTFTESLKPKTAGADSATEPVGENATIPTVTDAMGMTVPDFVDDSFGPKTLPSFVDANKDLAFAEGDPVPVEELDSALTLSPQLTALHLRLREIWEEEGAFVMVETLEDDIFYDLESVMHVHACCPLIYKASWARTMIGLCAGSAALAVMFTSAMIPVIEAYFKEMGVVEVTLRGIEREVNRFAMALQYAVQFGMEYHPEIGPLVDVDFYFY